MRMDTKQMIQHSLEGYYPSDGMAYLFGSRARGDANPDSDWDILLLINKDMPQTRIIMIMLIL